MDDPLMSMNNARISMDVDGRQGQDGANIFDTSRLSCNRCDFQNNFGGLQSQWTRFSVLFNTVCRCGNDRRVTWDSFAHAWNFEAPSFHLSGRGGT